MIGRLFRKPEPAVAPVDGPTAVAALLVRVARSDGEYADVEAQVVADVLARRYGADAGALQKAGEAREAELGDTVHLTRVIKDEIPLDERPVYLQDLWQVVLADSRRDHEEDGLMRLVSNLLGLADRDSALARQAVQARHA